MKLCVEVQDGKEIIGTFIIVRDFHTKYEILKEGFEVSSFENVVLRPIGYSVAEIVSKQLII